MFRTVLILALMLSLAGCGPNVSEPQAKVEGAIVTLPAVSGRPGAAYFTVRTNNDPTRLVHVSSPRIGRIELHETVTTNNVSRMVPLKDTTFDPETPLVFAPGGRHAMVFEIDPALRPGDRVTLEFNFEPAPPVTVEAEVRAAGDVGHGGH